MSTCEYKNNCSWYASLNKHTCNGKPVTRDDECNYYKVFEYLNEKDDLKPGKEYSTILLKYLMSQVD